MIIIVALVFVAVVAVVYVVAGVVEWLSPHRRRVRRRLANL